jgi:hypothetical protein
MVFAIRKYFANPTISGGVFFIEAKKINKFMGWI